ncbi:MAG: CoA-binding protein [Acidimicrobiia bacterium]
MSLADLLESADTTIAVVGATTNPSKYGNIIYHDLKSKGFKVFAVNPYRDEVDGDPCWRSLADLPEVPTIVDIVVPPARTLTVLQECLDLGLMNVWVQPGAGDQAVREFVEANGFNGLVGPCIMVEARTRAT